MLSVQFILSCVLGMSCHFFATVEARNPNRDDFVYESNCVFLFGERDVDIACSGTKIDVSQLPSSTVQLILVNTEILNFDNYAPFSHMASLKKLIITKTGPSKRYQVIPDGFFHGLANLETLKLSDNFFKKLSPNSFDDSSILKEVFLGQNLIIKLEWITMAFRKLKYLELVDFKESLTLANLTHHDFLPFQNSSVKVIDLSGSPITMVEEGVFASVPQLAYLDLSGFHVNESMLQNLLIGLNETQIIILKLRQLINIFSFPVKAISYLQYTKLETLYMDTNSFQVLPPHAFPYMPSLRNLSFHNSDLRSISLTAFVNIQNLEYLNLKSTRVTTIGVEFRPLTNLKYLDISTIRSLDTIHVKIPRNTLSNLMYLDLESTKMTYEITQETFEGLVNLKVLNLNFARVQGIQDHAFKSQAALEALHLKFSALGTLTNGTFFGLKNLRTSTLSTSEIQLIDGYMPFQHNPLLTSLDLSSNRLGALPRRLFQNLSHLKVLNLSHNAIIPWEESILHEQHNIEVLDLHDNKIFSVSDIMLQEFSTTSVLNLSSNPFDCGACEMRNFQKWLLTTKTKIANINESNAYTCLMPSFLKNKKITQVEVQDKHCSMVHRTWLWVTIFVSCIVLFSLITSFVVYKYRWYLKYWYFQFKSTVNSIDVRQSNSGYVYDAFVSYNEDDREWIRNELVPALENEETGPYFRLYLHDRDFVVGRTVTENILDAIEKSRKTILVLSESFLESHWCMLELHIAQHKLFEDTRDALILIRLSRIAPNKLTHNLKYLMKTRTCLFWTTNIMGQRLFWDKLRAAIGKTDRRISLQISSIT